jgi:hypothetical protein
VQRLTAILISASFIVIQVLDRLKKDEALESTSLCEASSRPRVPSPTYEFILSKGIEQSVTNIVQIVKFYLGSLIHQGFRLRHSDF